ncbi:MAG: ABC transporter ATP-binding protein [Clostridia bacterium]|nr:ABC transporter ATP-binding protein [Clostridia bacterium]MBQ6614453.1 ABC transporter ATP-binding protein [Clostridia bacterium]
MININGVSKYYDDFKSLGEINAKITDGSIFGLVGSNGSGKSTLLRIMSGIFRADGGEVLYDGENVYENVALKNRIVYLSDDQFFLPNATLGDMAKMYASVYSEFSFDEYNRLLSIFGLDPSRKISTFSKGMQKQSAILLGLSAKPKYLLCDETFDGLDPVMRQFVKRILADAVAEEGLTAIIASHNLRELEDICDHIGLLHKGGILFESEIDTLKENIHTVQAVFSREITTDEIAKIGTVSIKQRGSMVTAVVRGSEGEVREKIEALGPEFYEIIPLTLEEIFISEMEERGYDYTKVVF